MAEAVTNDILSALASKNAASLRPLLDQMVDSHPQPAAKKAIKAIISVVADEQCDPAFSAAVCEICIPKLSAGNVYADECLRFKEILADHLERRDMHKELQQLLASMTFEPALQRFKDYGHYLQLSVYTRMAGSFQCTDDQIKADEYVKKAWTVHKNIIEVNKEQRELAQIQNRGSQKVKTPEEIQAEQTIEANKKLIWVAFLTSYASWMDGERKSLEAAQRYFDLSHLDSDIGYLQRAIVCVIVGDAGPHRSRLLAALYKDDRTSRLGDLYIILSKVFHLRVLRPKDVALLAPFLMAHHHAVTSTGRTYVQNAILQHNIQAASQIYRNITFADLGALLNISTPDAEAAVANMIGEDRLKATIDQVAGLIRFFENSAAAIHDWDDQISSTCNAVATIGDSVMQKHTQYAEVLKNVFKPVAAA